MKTIKSIFAASVLLCAVSCGEDDNQLESSSGGNNQGQTIAVNNNDSEDKDISLTVLEQGLSIEGAEKLKEPVPTPNGQTSFEIENTQSAFLNAGFEFELQVPEDYAGSYIQIQSADGTQTSDSYFDVPAIRSFKQVNERSRKGFKLTTVSQTQTPPVSVDELSSTEEIRVDFNNQVPAGKFCYVICVYDTDGNVSLPQTVCVEVEAWGGNNDIVGSWKYVKVEETVNGGTTNTTNVNEEDCNADAATFTLECESGETLSYTDQYCDTTISLVLNINADGSQSLSSEYDSDYFDYGASRTQCKEIFIKENYKYNSSGNWAYDEEENKMTLVEFDYTETVDGVVEESNEDDEADFGFEVEVVSVTSNNLVVQFSETYLSYNPNTQQSEQKTEVIRYFFEK